MKSILFLCVNLVALTLAQYCQSGPTTSVDGNLGKVVLNGDSKGINDPLDCPGYAGVKDQTTLSADLHPGGAYTLQYNVTTCGNPFPTVSGAWIDYNQNGTFDSDEILFPFNRSTPTAWVSNSFTVPSSAKAGTTRMRVQVQETSSTGPLDPCYRFAYGGTKDFTIVIGSGSGASSSGGLSGGSVFIIIVLVASVVYVVGGCAFNKLKKGTSGAKESCPNNEFWFDLPALVKDGFLFTKSKLTGKGGDGYDKIEDNL